MPAKLEMEIAQLPPEEADVFLAEYGIEEPSLDRFISLSYELLGLISFFTAGEKEVHAWTVSDKVQLHLTLLGPFILILKRALFEPKSSTMMT